MQRVIDALRAHLDDSVERTIQRVNLEDLSFYRGLPPEQLRGMIRRALMAAHDDLHVKTGNAFPSLLASVATRRADAGASISVVLRGLMIGFEVMSDHIREVFSADVEAQLWWERARFRVCSVGSFSFADAYLLAREDLIRTQAEELVRLAAPIIPLHRGVVVLPLVGTVDERRAHEITAALLNAIGARGAHVVLIDVTGVPIVDAPTADALLRATRAARLLGAEVVLVGINGSVARIMIETGIDLGDVTTLGSLEAGVEYALALQGKAIAKRPRARVRA